jgi:hypothetical protein
MDWHTVLGTARYEARLLVRRRAFWVVQVALLAALHLMVPGAWHDSGYDAIGSVIQGFLLFAPLFLAFLVAPAASRDRGPLGDVLWATPLGVLEHTLGKFLGILVVIALAIVAQLAVRWSSWQLDIRPGVGALPMAFWRYALPLTLPMMVWVVALPLFLGTLFRRSIVVYVVVAAWWLVVDLGFVVPSGNMVSPWNFSFAMLELSPTVGLGPEAPLARGIVAVHLTLGITLAVLTAWALLRVERRSDWPMAQRRVALGLTLAGVGSLAVTFLMFRTAAARAVVPQPPSAPQAEAWQVDDYQLTADLALDTGTIRGVMTLTLRYEGEDPTNQVVLQLNPTLHADSVAGPDDAPLVFTQRGEAVTVELETSLSHGEKVTLTVGYGGHPRLAREDYGAFTGSMISSSWETLPLPVRGYFGDNITYLLRDGDWYPWPFTANPRRANQARVRLSVPTGVLTVSSADTVLETDRQVHIWEGTPPQALLVAYAPGLLEHSQDHVLVPPAMADELGDEARTYLDVTRALEKRLGQPTDELLAVALPYLTQPAVAHGLIFFPEGSGAPASYQGKPWGEGRTPTVMFRYHADRLAQAWWGEKVAFPPLVLSRGASFMSVDIRTGSPTVILAKTYNLQVPDGRLVPAMPDGPALGVPHAVESLHHALAHYTALWLTGMLTGDTPSVEADLALWQRGLEVAQTEKTRGSLEELTAQFKASAEVWQQLASRSLHTGPYLGQRAALVVTLAEAHQALGDEGFADLLRAFIARFPAGGQAIATPEALFEMAGQRTGEDFVGRWQARQPQPEPDLPEPTRGQEANH